MSTPRWEEEDVRWGDSPVSAAGVDVELVSQRQGLGDELGKVKVERVSHLLEDLAFIGPDRVGGRRYPMGYGQPAANTALRRERPSGRRRPAADALSKLVVALAECSHDDDPLGRSLPGHLLVEGVAHVGRQMRDHGALVANGSAGQTVGVPR